jgi:hypothetical protein
MENFHPFNPEFIKHLSQCRDTDNLIIKGHILTEYSLNCYIENKSAEKINIDETRFTYYNKIEISKILGLYKIKPELYNELKLLNKLRNSIAHKLKFDENILKQFVAGFNKYKHLYDSESIDLLKVDNAVVYDLGNEKILLQGEHLMFMFYISIICQHIFDAFENEKE